MPQQNWWYTNLDAGGNPQRNLVPQSTMFDLYNRDVAGGLPGGTGLTAAQLGGLWDLRRLPTAQPTAPANVATPPPPIAPAASLIPKAISRTTAVNPATSLQTSMAPMLPMPTFNTTSLTPTDQEFTDALNRAKQVDENNRAYYERMNPGSTSTNDQLSRNIADAAAGRLAPEDEANILRQGAEMGAAMGVPGSPAALSGTLARYYGGIQGLKDKAEALASSQYNRTAKPTSPNDYLVKPEQKIQLVIEQARLTQAALTANQEATLKLQLQTMIESGRGLDRDMSLTLKEMEQNGQIRHDETVRLIAEADRIAGNYRAELASSGENYRAGLANSGLNYRAQLGQSGENYRTNVAANNQWNLGNLRYGNRGSVNFPTTSNYPTASPYGSVNRGPGQFAYNPLGAGVPYGTTSEFDPITGDPYWNAPSGTNSLGSTDINSLDFNYYATQR